jgi:hypothetical protein
LVVGGGEWWVVRMVVKERRNMKWSGGVVRGGEGDATRRVEWKGREGDWSIGFCSWVGFNATTSANIGDGD